MDKVNYQVMLDKIIEDIVHSNSLPSLLMHSCCAPLSYKHLTLPTTPYV